MRDASPDAWGRHVIEHLLGKTPSDLEEVDYLLHGPQDGAGSSSFYNIISQSARFGLTTDAARAEFERIVGVVRDWRTLFRSLGVAERDLDYIAPAFLPPSLFFDQPPMAV